MKRPNYPTQLIIVLNPVPQLPAPYSDQLVMSSKSILMRNCKHHREVNESCEYCAGYSARDNSCKMGLPCTWK